MKLLVATALVGLIAQVSSFPGIVDSHFGSGGLSLIGSEGGGGFGGSHDSYGSSLSSGGDHSFGGLSSGDLGGSHISISSIGGGHGDISGGISGGYGGGHEGGGGSGGFSGGDHHHGVSIVSIGEGKGASFDLTGGHSHQGKLFGGTIISSGKHEGGAHAQQASGGGYGGDLGDEHHLLSGAANGLSGGGHEISSVIGPSDWSGHGLGGGGGLSLSSGGGHGLGGGIEYAFESGHH